MERPSFNWGLELSFWLRLARPLCTFFLSPPERLLRYADPVALLCLIGKISGNAKARFRIGAILVRLRPRWAEAVLAGLLRRTADRPVRTKHATIAGNWLEPDPTTFAVIKKLAGIYRHLLDRLMAARGTCDGRLRDHVAL